MDIANLGITVTNKGVEATKDSLKGLTAAAGGAEKAVEGLAGDAKAADKALEGLSSEAKTTAGSLDMMARSINDRPVTRYADSITKAGKSAGVAAHDLKNMQFQVVDVVQGLLTGQRPMQVFMQQSGQIGQLAATSGASLGQWASALGLLNPLFLAVAAGAGILAAGLFGLKGAADKAADNKDFVKSLGLTHAEMKKVKDTSVTLGDTFKGLGKTVIDLWYVIDDGKVISKGVAGAFGVVKKAVGEAVSAVVSGVEVQVAAFVGGARAIGKAWGQIPGAIGDWVLQASNATVKGVEWMVNQSIGGLNAMINMFHLEGMFGKIGDINIGTIKNPFAGKGLAFGKTFGDEFNKGVAESMKAMGKTIDNIVNASHDRLRKEAKDIIDDRNPKKGKRNDPFSMIPDRYQTEVEMHGKVTPWDEFTKLGKVAMRQVEEFTGKMPALIDKWAAMKEAGRDFARSVGDAFYDASTGADSFFDSLTGGLARLAAQWAASDIEHIINKLFKIDDSDTYKASPISGLGDAIAGWFGKSHSTPSYDGGGYTGSGPRSGGIDGKGGFWAVMHPQETVTDHTKGQNAPGNSGDMQTAVLQAVQAITGHIARTSGRVADAKVYKYDRQLPTRMGSLQRQGT